MFMHKYIKMKKRKISWLKSEIRWWSSVFTGALLIWGSITEVNLSNHVSFIKVGHSFLNVFDG